MTDSTVTPVSNRNFTGDILNNYFYEYWIGKVTDPAQPILWHYLGDGISNITPKYTDKKKNNAYYNGGGSEKPTVTGLTASYDISGDRSFHNPAQDLIAGMKYSTGNRRQLWFRKNEYTQNSDGSLSLIGSEFGVATFTDIDDGGGAADDNGGFKATATYNAAPTVIKESDKATLNQILLQTPCQNASITHVPLRQPQVDGTVKTYNAENLASNAYGDMDNSRPATLEEAQTEAEDKDEVESAIANGSSNHTSTSPTSNTTNTSSDGEHSNSSTPNI
ncbi:MAG: phage tail tube protein [Lactobacillaceae bacterium]